MRKAFNRLKPAKGMSTIFHFSILALLPIVIFALVRINDEEFTRLAIILILISKWRMFAVRPRFWLANIRANAVDLMVGVSIVVFMTNTNSIFIQLGWVLAYEVWLLYLKPASSSLFISIQAGIAQLCALSALYVYWSNGPIYGLTIATGLICYLTARHFYDAFDEKYSRLLSYLWAYFGASMAWLLAHWLLFYGFIAQPTVMLAVISYGIGGIYYWDHKEKLTKIVKSQFVVVMTIVVLFMLIFSDWGSKIV